MYSMCYGYTHVFANAHHIHISRDTQCLLLICTALVANDIMCQPQLATLTIVPILEAYWFQQWASDSVTPDYSIHDFFILSTGLKGLIWGPLSMSCSHIFAGVKKDSWSTFFERGLFVVKTRQWSNPNVRSFRKDKHHWFERCWNPEIQKLKWSQVSLTCWNPVDLHHFCYRPWTACIILCAVGCWVSVPQPSTNETMK